jgi:hypothetical protein
MAPPRMVLHPRELERFLREFSFESLHHAWEAWGRERVNTFLARCYMTPSWLELVQ